MFCCWASCVSSRVGDFTSPEMLELYRENHHYRENGTLQMVPLIINPNIHLLKGSLWIIAAPMSTISTLQVLDTLIRRETRMEDSPANRGWLLDPKILVPQNGWWKSWKTPIEMDDLGGPPLFLETPICCFFVCFFFWFGARILSKQMNNVHVYRTE